MFSLEMFLEPSADSQIRALWQELTTKSIVTLPEVWARPHITLAICSTLDGIDHKALGAVCEDMPQNIKISTYGQFLGAPGVLQLGLTPTRELMALHGAVHDVLDSTNSACDPLYVPDVWIPHCTISMGMKAEDLGTLRTTLQNLKPIAGRITEIAWVDNRAGRELSVASPF
ncbi:2'-5' RNA ligase family protein [Streptomyces sp. NPDC051362]|uniref:2'-5' RNA ligase family protein n=1 Tax=Streptomyces sp. NPDC051362 TaxID=3365651 RepID=UPI0037BAB50A